MLHLIASAVARRSVAPVLLATLIGLAAACSENSTGVEDLAAQFKGKPDKPKPSDPGVPLEITLGATGALAAVGGVYSELADPSVATHLSGVNGNLMFDLRGSQRFVLVSTTGQDPFNGNAVTRIYTNNGPSSDGLRGLTSGFGTAVLEAEWRAEGYFYSLRYGKDCNGGTLGLEGDKARVDVTAAGWTITGQDDAGILCRRPDKGKKQLNPVGGGGAFDMTLVQS
jgi:hypothetical protein